MAWWGPERDFCPTPQPFNIYFGLFKAYHLFWIKLDHKISFWELPYRRKDWTTVQTFGNFKLKGREGSYSITWVDSMVYEDDDADEYTESD